MEKQIRDKYLDLEENIQNLSVFTHMKDQAKREILLDIEYQTKELLHLVEKLRNDYR